VFRYEQWHRGLPVFNSVATVFIDDAGGVRTLASNTHAIPLQDLTPTLDPQAALHRALEQAVAPEDAFDVKRARLGLLPKATGVYLAYRVDLPSIPALLQAPTLYIDAHDGRLLRRVNRIWFVKRAKVYRQNPVATPNLEEVTLTWLPDAPVGADGGDPTDGGPPEDPDAGTGADPDGGGPAAQDGGSPADGGEFPGVTRSEPGFVLENDRVIAVNCIDRHHTIRVSMGSSLYNIHVCDEIHKAEADQALDFLYDPPPESSPARLEDEFAEVQVFYHINKIYDFFQSLGFETMVPSTRGQPTQIWATVNYRPPIDLDYPDQSSWDRALDPNAALVPMENAFFMAAAGSGYFLERDRDSLIIGQGTAVDFAYDGDVVYHEFTHAVVNSTAQLGYAVMDEYGLDSGPGAMNEGYGDYFSSALTGDPKVGEYASRSFAEGTGAIRDLENGDVCPDQLWGESHQDSQAFSGGLWQARQLVGEGNRLAYDAAVYAALASLTSESGFEAAATATVEQVRARLGDEIASSVRAVYEQRGLLGCNNRIVYYQGPRDLLILEGTGDLGIEPFVPGYYQIRFEVPANRNQIVVSYGLVGVSGYGQGAADVRLLVSRGSPIKFSYEGSVVPAEGVVEVQPQSVSRPSGGRGYEARFSQVEVPGPHYVMLVNRGSSQVLVRNLTVTAALGTPDGGVRTDGGVARDGGLRPDGGAPRRDGGLPLADAGLGPGGTTPGQQGGGCAAGGDGLSGLGATLAALLALVSLRRRARRHGSRG
jgi:hypothetical protein